VGDAGPEAASFAALVDDPALWQRIPNPGACDLHEGKAVPDPFPKRVWSACGPGCLLTPATPAFSPAVVAYQTTTASDYVNGGVYMTSSFGNQLARITRVERLPDGETIAATMSKGTFGVCALAYGGGSAVFMFQIFGGDEGSRFARAPKAAGEPIGWQPDWRTDVPGGTERFVFDDGVGCGPYLMTDDTGPVVGLSGGPDRSAARGKQLVWCSSATPAIKAFTKAGGQVDLVPLPGRGAIAVALSDERMVWVSAPGIGYSEQGWHWSPRAEDPAEIVVHDGPSLGGNVPLSDIKTAGDWAAATRCPVPNDVSKCQVVVWNMATNETFAFVGRPGHFFPDVLAVAPTEVYLQESIVRPSAPRFDNIVRLEVSALSALAAGAGWAQ
jgi:hypothetical protein